MDNEFIIGFMAGQTSGSGGGSGSGSGEVSRRDLEEVRELAENAFPTRSKSQNSAVIIKDGYPGDLKELEFTLNPINIPPASGTVGPTNPSTIIGYTGINIITCGNNIIDDSYGQFPYTGTNGVVRKLDDGGYYLETDPSFSGFHNTSVPITFSDNDSTYQPIQAFRGKKLYFSVITQGSAMMIGGSLNVSFVLDDDTTTSPSYTSAIVPDNAVGIKATLYMSSYVLAGQNVNYYPMILLDNSITEYTKPYSDVHSYDWQEVAGEIVSGVLDVLNGTLAVTGKKLHGKNMTWEIFSGNTSSTNTVCQTPIDGIGAVGVVACDKLAMNGMPTMGFNGYDFGVVSGYLRVALPVSVGTSLQDIIAWMTDNDPIFSCTVPTSDELIYHLGGQRISINSGINIITSDRAASYEVDLYPTIYEPSINCTYVSDPSAPFPSDSTPLADGVASAGASFDYARADHVHPSIVRVGTINVSIYWSGDGPYTQPAIVYDLDSSYVQLTNNSKVDLQPSAEVLTQLMSDGVTALFATNTNGSLKLTALGAAPTANFTIQCVVTEVST